MATGSSPQRAYRAACPNCGAPVEFASAASASAVCSFCRSTLVRDGEALRRIGTSAELFDDHSPLQLGAQGRYQGVAFTLVGRLQYGYAEGTWNEWHALFDGGSTGPRSGWLSEDNGAYVFAFDAPPQDAPRAEDLEAGQARTIAGRAWTVASVTRATLIAAQGELPYPPRLQGEFIVADLRNAQDEVATLDYSDPAKPHWSTGRSVALSMLSMSGLKEDADKSLAGRAFDCPNCGNALEVKLSSTQSLSCGSCKSVVDVSQGVGADLTHFTQNNSGVGGLEPQIPLGATGRLVLGGGQAEPWQVVGYMERCDIPAPGDDEEQTFWREYLLYNRAAGFAFLVDAEDGWSWVKPLTGAPQVKGLTAVWKGVNYRQRYSYKAKVTWVLGEFYWKVRREEVAQVTDYDAGGADAKKKLSREKTPGEVTWSAGEALDSNVIATAFKIPLDKQAAMRRDAAPLSFDASKAAGGLAKTVIIVLVIVVVMIIMATCSSSSDCDDERRSFGESSAEYQQCARNRSTGSSSRTGGGSFGGYSSGGGGHK